MRKIGVVIQGPILSRGFDSTQTIEQMTTALLRQPLVGRVVISTWANEHFASDDERVTVLHSPLPAGRDVLNRRRQWTSTLAGVQALQQDPHISHVLKLRTDQVIPTIIIKFMSDFYSARTLRVYTGDSAWNDRIFQEPMVFSLVNRSVPFHIGDFFFAGKIEDVAAFLKSNLQFGSHIFQKAPEIDSVLKHVFLHDPAFPLSLWQRYQSVMGAKNMPRSRMIWQYWYQLYRLYFGCFPRGIFNQVQWRGVPWVTHVNQRLQFERGQEIVDRYYDFYDEWQLLRNEPEKYLQLPFDPMITGRLSKRDWLEVAQGVGEWVVGASKM